MAFFPPVISFTELRRAALVLPLEVAASGGLNRRAMEAASRRFEVLPFRIIFQTKMNTKSIHR